MLIKFGQEQHMVDLRDKGAMFFNPIKKFRELEEEQRKKALAMQMMVQYMQQQKKLGYRSQIKWLYLITQISLS